MFGISGLESFLGIVLALAVPAAVIYVIYLLRRIAKNTSPKR